ncbi:hypothetical protein BJF79_35760 [Actinomadura sp. CNU-125]|uniref:hypothetical protein n=1 Tax=Actinomadura sp. CNU-125 TaxID=1904961 RepID=UPI00096138F0|nr:hypothetical protein [Actinomadura sp. CNU-125]OLT32649.1 hypothetical protein BJF79_35760 [Actinomadura sp. CNU-125]
MHELFWFDVGQYERHRVEFFFDRMWARVKISVDGEVVLTKRMLLAWRKTERFQFTVGHEERHEVVIDKTRKTFAPGFRPSTYRVFADGVFLFTLEGQG